MDGWMGIWGERRNLVFSICLIQNSGRQIMLASVFGLHTSLCSSRFYTPCSSSLIDLRLLCGKPQQGCHKRKCTYLFIHAYMEDSDTISGFANKVVGSLPVIGLIARVFNAEGGVGGDIIDFAEFRRRVGNKCSVNDSRAFYEFHDRRGKAGDPLYVLLCCWLAAVGAGLLKTEEILEGVARLRISNDIEFEEENFIDMMKKAREKRAKAKADIPKIPMGIRAEKAVEAIYVCSFWKDGIEEDDIQLLVIMLNAVFPSVGSVEIERIVKEKAKSVAEGGSDETFKVLEPKPLPKEAVQLQMKDLEFLRKGIIDKRT